MSEEVKRNYIVYKIVLEDGYEYVGSTNDYKHRILEHKSRCFNKNSSGYNIPLYKHIRKHNLKFDKDNFVVLKKLQNITETEARMFEEKYRKEAVLQGGNVLNAFRAYRTEEEKGREHIAQYKAQYDKNNKEYNAQYFAQYRQNNKEKIAERGARYYQNNKEKISQKFDCPCGSIYTRSNKARHFKTKKHLDYLSKIKK